MIAHQEILKKDKQAAGGGAGAAPAATSISLEAKGNVYYVAADGRRVHGDNAFYDYGQRPPSPSPAT